jgi:predicted HNH restriction endonuclease
VLNAESKLSGKLGERAREHLELLRHGVNDTSLESSAEGVFEAFNLVHKDIPLLATPADVAIARALETADETTFPETSGKEGRKKVVAHVLRERNKALVKSKKADFRKKHGAVHCECCGLTPEKMYGHEVEGIIEAHHKVPLGECADDEVRVTSLEDLVLLCRNCHGAIHRISPMPDLLQLRSMLRMVPRAPAGS